MRTTASFDPDVSVLIDSYMARTKKRFKEALNDLVRAGYSRLEVAKEPRSGTFCTPTFNLGEPRIDITNYSEALSLVEGPAHR